jgi:hypothetical protein
MKIIKMLPLAAALAAIGSAHAAGIGVRAGTTGLGGDIGWGIAPTLSARVGYAGYNRDTSTESNSVKYDAKLKLSNLNAVLDWSPLGPFRITGGFVANQNKYTLTGTPSAAGTYDFIGTSFTAADIGTVSGTVKPGRSTAPYLGIGWGNVAGKGVNFYFDLGVILQGSPKATLSANCGPVAAAQTGGCAKFESDVAAEQAKLEDKLKGFKNYPVINVGLTIGF